MNVDRCAIFEHLWPRPPCLLCGNQAGRVSLCKSCLAELPWINAACRLCALPLPKHGLCPSCQLRPPPFARTIAALRYEYPADRLIQRFKFEERPGYALTLGVLLARIAAALSDPLPDALVPVPLHRGRLAERGYNQSLELAKTVAAEIGLPLLPRACRRVRPTLAQSSLDPAARRRNIRGAFSIEPQSLPPRLAIVDDVMTSGQTVTELARVLRQGGVVWIEVWCLARAVRR